MESGRHAIVVGASIGGLLAARALADFFERVTVLERDVLEPGNKSRKGVPQGRHIHALLARGREVIEQLFPGFCGEMEADGALCCDVVDQCLWFEGEAFLCNVPSRLIGLASSRPMLENGIRRRLLQNRNISLREQCDVLEPTFDRARGTVTGVRVRRRARADELETIEADLVVDASGRGSHSPTWLSDWGYAKPRVESIQINQGYVTQHYRRRPEHLNGKLAVMIAAAAPRWRGGTILAQEDDRWIVTMGGKYLGDQAPKDEVGFLEFARLLPRPEIYDVVKQAEPLSPVIPFNFSASSRRHYEELSRFPNGFLVFGDALCSFNPYYGQGMTVAAMEAVALRDCLRAGQKDLARRFFGAASRHIDRPWHIAANGDLRDPKVEGKRTTRMRLFNWYLPKFVRAAHADGVLATKFLEVTNLVRRPETLLSPQTMLRVMRRRIGAAETGPDLAEAGARPASYAWRRGEG